MLAGAGEGTTTVRVTAKHMLTMEEATTAFDVSVYDAQPLKDTLRAQGSDERIEVSDLVRLLTAENTTDEDLDVDRDGTVTREDIMILLQMVEPKSALSQE